MDGSRFDTLTRALAQTSSRRSLLRGTVAALAGGLALRRHGDATAASCGTFCNDLPPGRQRGECARACAADPGLIAACSGNPERLCVADDGTATCCRSDQTCAAGTCACPAGHDECAGACVDTHNDALNCGACGYRCPFNEHCRSAICRCGDFTPPSTPYTCCNPGGGFLICTPPDHPSIIPADWCDVSDAASTCPDGYATCIGDTCKICCPPGTTCDNGFCRQ